MPRQRQAGGDQDEGAEDCSKHRCPRECEIARVAQFVAEHVNVADDGDTGNVGELDRVITCWQFAEYDRPIAVDLKRLDHD